MAEILPSYSEQELSALRDHSPAEERVYRAARALPPAWVVIHGLRSIDIEPGRGPRDGESDFVVLHPDYGMLCIEVKGGEVGFQGGHWVRHVRRRARRIKDPFEQALAQKHTLVQRVNRSEGWRRLGLGRMLCRHAVLLPDVASANPVALPHVEAELVGGSPEVSRLVPWIERAFGYGADKESWAPLGARGVRAVRDALAADFSTQPLLGFRIDQEERERIILTNEQWLALRELRVEEELAVAGGAGTGKTLLALRRAQDSARAGLRTLLLCYNRPLADFLKHENLALIDRGEVAKENLVTASFHEFCRWVIEGHAHPQTGVDYFAEAQADHPMGDELNVQWPQAMALALEDRPLTYDVVIVDEGQDFGNAHWFALHPVRRSARWKFVFFDPNQSIFRRVRSFPVTQEKTRHLTKNCRSTRHIHDLSYRFYDGTAVEPPAIAGTEVICWEAARTKTQAQRLAAELTRWVNEDRIQAHDIAVLVLDSTRKQLAYDAARRAFGRSLPLSVERHGHPGHVLIDTVARFKGLEALVVVVWVTGPMGGEAAGALRYVGFSRARSLLALVGDRSDLEWAKGQLGAE